MTAMCPGCVTFAWIRKEYKVHDCLGRRRAQREALTRDDCILRHKGIKTRYLAGEHILTLLCLGELLMVLLC
jgi:hypothetical protein